MPTIPARLTGLVASAGVATALTACGSAIHGPDLARCAPAAGALILEFSVHQNAAAPDVPEDLGCLIEATVLHGMPVSVVGIDGTPAVDALVNGRTFPIRTGNAAAARADAAVAVATVVAAVRALEADSDGADVLAGMGLARDLAVSGGTSSATVVLVDPLVPDTGALRLTEPGWLYAEPAEVADHLEDSGQLPPADGLHYLLVGVGHTAAPQQPLPTAVRDNLTAIWTAVLERGGAQVAIDPRPRQGQGPDTPFTTQTVTVSEIDQPTPCTGAPLVYDNTSPVGFQPDSDVLRDPAAAAEVLAGVADWLLADPRRHAEIVGTTANVGDMAGQEELSRRRAATVERLLLDLGVPAGQLHSDGVGSAFDDYVDDAGNPAARQLNRTVRITLTGPHSSC